MMLWFYHRRSLSIVSVRRGFFVLALRVQFTLVILLGPRTDSSPGQRRLLQERQADEELDHECVEQVDKEGSNERDH